MWCVLQFATICLIMKHKNTCEGTLTLVKVAGWSAKTNIPPKMMQIVPKPKQSIFLDSFGLFFPSFLKTRIIPHM